MSPFWPLHSGLGVLALAGLAVAGIPGDADARTTVLADEAATITRALAVPPGGGPGLRLDDNLFQLPSIPPVLPASRQVARVSGATPADSAPALIGRGPYGLSLIHI